MEKFKWYCWVFFARIRAKREIKRIKRHINDLIWTICVEKNNDKKLVEDYEFAKTLLSMREIALKALVYA